MFVDGKQTPSLLLLLNLDINCSKDYCKALGVYVCITTQRMD
jgi:hypothetical protein